VNVVSKKREIIEMNIMIIGMMRDESIMPPPSFGERGE
jgi:hypothetical protein